jgi:hypothetical protein
MLIGREVVYIFRIQTWSKRRIRHFQTCSGLERHTGEALILELDDMSDVKS